MSVQLGSLAIIAGKNTQFQGAPQSGSQAILIGNESGLTCTITMEGGNVSKTLYPSTVDWFQIKPGFSGNIKIVPTALLNNVATWPSSSLIFDAIGLDDPEQASMYPISLNRNNNIGNSVSTTGGSTTSVTNDNQALTPSNVFIEATPTNASGSTISIATDGTVTIKGDVANVLTTLLQLLPAAAAGASSVKLSDAARQTEVLGSLLVDGAETVTGVSTFTGDATFNGANIGLAVTNNETVGGTLNVTGVATLSSGISATGGVATITGNAAGALHLGQSATGDTLDTDASDTYLKSGNVIHVQIPGGADVGLVNGNGFQVAAGKKYHFNGSDGNGLANFSEFGPYTVTTTPTFFNHNLGQVPDMVLVNVTGTSTSVFTVEWDPATISGTQVKLTSNSAGGVTVRGVAFKS